MRPGFLSFAQLNAVEPSWISSSAPNSEVRLFWSLFAQSLEFGSDTPETKTTPVDNLVIQDATIFTTPFTTLPWVSGSFDCDCIGLAVPRYCCSPVQWPA